MPDYSFQQRRFDTPSFSDMMANSRAMGASVGGLIGAGTQESRDKTASAKEQELLARYNDPNETAFLGLAPAARARKMAQLLLPYNKEKAARYEDLATELEAKERKSAEDKAFGERLMAALSYREPAPEPAPAYRTAEEIQKELDELDALHLKDSSAGTVQWGQEPDPALGAPSGAYSPSAPSRGGYRGPSGSYSSPAYQDQRPSYIPYQYPSYTPYQGRR